MCASFPAARVPARFPAGPALRHQPTWTPVQIRSFLVDVQDDRLYAAFVLAASTGMRRGEVLGLHWNDVDFVNSRIAIRHSLITVNYKVQLSTPKTGRSQRSIPLDQHTVSQLKAHKARQAGERLAWDEAYVDQDFVFATEDGTPVHPERFTQLFDRYVKNSDLPRIRLHDLRHTYATLSLSAGEGCLRSPRTRNCCVHVGHVHARCSRNARGSSGEGGGIDLRPPIAGSNC